MATQTSDKVNFLINFVDTNMKGHRTRLATRILLPAILILATSLLAIFLVVYQWTSLPILSFTPGAVSIIAILISFYSYSQSTVKAVNRDVTLAVATRLRERLEDKSDETFYLLIALVALKENNYPLKLSTLYKLNPAMFSPKTLVKHYYIG